jgi:hypothetical protein
VWRLLPTFCATPSQDIAFSLPTVRSFHPTHGSKVSSCTHKRSGHFPLHRIFTVTFQTTVSITDSTAVKTLLGARRMPSPARELPFVLKARRKAYSYCPVSYHHKRKMPAASVASAPVNRTTNRAAASRAKKPASNATKKSQPATNGAVNGAQNGAHNMSPYTIMASRIANRVAEMAENITFVERNLYVQIPSLSVPLRFR